LDPKTDKQLLYAFDLLRGTKTGDAADTTKAAQPQN
jgi:hypothetical protein